MNMIKSLCVMSVIVTAPILHAQSETQPKTYGDNPNIFSVLAHKTGEAVQNTVEKIGNVTERGIQKIKPSLDSTIENTKTYTTEQATIARDNTREGIDTAIKKAGETKDKIFGKTSSNVPIEQGTLSQSTSSNQANANTIPSTTALNSNAQMISQPLQQIPLNQNAQNHVENQISNQAQNNVQEEQEIKKQSLPIANNANNQTLNTTHTSSNANSNTGSTVTSAKDSSNDDEGVPR